MDKRTRVVLRRNEGKTLWVAPEIHASVKLYAMRRGISMVEATHSLLRVAFQQVRSGQSAQKGSR